MFEQRVLNAYREKVYINQIFFLYIYIYVIRKGFPKTKVIYTGCSRTTTKVIRRIRGRKSAERGT
jgi:hypothetical protein